LTVFQVGPGGCIWLEEFAFGRVLYLAVKRKAACAALPTHRDGFRVGEGLSGDVGLHVPSLSSLLKKSVECFDEGMASGRRFSPWGVRWACVARAKDRY